MPQSIISTIRWKEAAVTSPTKADESTMFLCLTDEGDLLTGVMGGADGYDNWHWYASAPIAYWAAPSDISAPFALRSDGQVSDELIRAATEIVAGDSKGVANGS